MTDAERQTLEEIGAVRTDPGPEPAEVGEPLDDGWPAEADRTAPVIEPREMAELAGLLMSVATRLRTAAAPGAFGRKDFAASLDPVLADVATAVRLLVEFLNTDCADNKLALASVERLRRGALSWPGIYYAHPAAQIREQKRKPKLGSKLPLKMNNAKGPSAEARAAVDVLLTVQEHIFWLLALQPQKDGRPARADARTNFLRDTIVSRRTFTKQFGEVFPICAANSVTRSLRAWKRGAPSIRWPASANGPPAS